MTRRDVAEAPASSSPREPAVSGPLAATDLFPERHVGPREADVAEMLGLLGCPSLDALIDDTVPEGIRLRKPLSLRDPVGEHELLDELSRQGATSAGG